MKEAWQLKDDRRRKRNEEDENDNDINDDINSEVIVYY